MKHWVFSPLSYGGKYFVCVCKSVIPRNTSAALRVTVQVGKLRAEMIKLTLYQSQSNLP